MKLAPGTTSVRRNHSRCGARGLCGALAFAPQPLTARSVAMSNFINPTSSRRPVVHGAVASFAHGPDSRYADLRDGVWCRSSAGALCGRCSRPVDGAAPDSLICGRRRRRRRRRGSTPWTSIWATAFELADAADAADDEAAADEAA